MKKYLFVPIIFGFVLTGCGAGATETMSCTHENAAGNMTSKIVYNVDYEKAEVKKIRITYDYHQDIDVDDTDSNDNLSEDNSNTDGIGTGTDGTTNDTQLDNDGIIDGIVGSAIDSFINGMTDTILDISGIRSRHENVQNTYGNMTGFSVQNTNDTADNNYRVSYIIDFDNMSDSDLNALNISRDIDTLRSNYTSQGFTCTK